ncbi:hypothetical protein ACFQ7J_21730 [Streptomyces sp. NPDC056501]|uniref:hypothetical protein n=1 Tax=Streptomyces sp. NPDC056501 TaxID=3345841 RepID=UPI0036983DCF
MAVNVVPWGAPGAGDDDDSDARALVGVVLMFMTLVAAGLLDPDQALQALSVIAALFHRGR